MKKFLLFLLCCRVLVAEQPARLYPNPNLTPGETAKVTQEQVLKVGYTVDARHVTNGMKWQVFVRYGMVDDGPINKERLSALLRKYEVDHFISLELGGANTLKNLWPQPYFLDVQGVPMGARQKDVVETALHRMIKKGTLTLQEAQDIIRSDWARAYREIKAGKPLTKVGTAGLTTFGQP